MQNVPMEAQEQAALFEWAEYASGKWPELKLLYHIANGGSRHPAEARNLKLQGVKPGVPDIFLPVARKGYHGLYLEMKRRKGGRVSIDQKVMMTALQEQGYRCEVCKGWEEARDVIEDYLT